jgi:hypothetical protein
MMLILVRHRQSILRATLLLNLLQELQLLVLILQAAAFVGDGSGLTNVSGGGGASSRTVVSGITTALVVNGIGNTEISGFKTYGVLKVGVSSAAWVRLYTDSTSRSNDASRSIEVDPITGSGVIAEVATAGIATVKMTPFIVGFNDDLKDGGIIWQ